MRKIVLKSMSVDFPFWEGVSANPAPWISVHLPLICRFSTSGVPFNICAAFWTFDVIIIVI